MAQVKEVSFLLPHSALDHADWADAYQVSVPSGRMFANAREAGEAIVLGFPSWTRPLLVLRGLIMAPFGLKGPEHIRKMRVDAIGFFPIVSQNDHCLVAGFDDSHLDFRLVVELETLADSRNVSLATIIRRNNRIGRIYLAAILPFHRMIVKAALRNAVAPIS